MNKVNTFLLVLFLFFMRRFSLTLVCKKLTTKKKKGVGKPCGSSRIYIFTKKVGRSVESSLQYVCPPMKTEQRNYAS